jgi:hypothetical protein
MLRHQTSTQQHCAAATSPSRRRRVSAPLSLLDGRVKVTSGSGRTLDRAASAPVVVNQTKLAIVAVMQQLGCPVSSTDLQKIWAEHKALEIFEYHLSTLVKARVVEIVFGRPELHFRLVGRA